MLSRAHNIKVYTVVSTTTELAMPHDCYQSTCVVQSIITEAYKIAIHVDELLIYPMLLLMW